MNTQLLEVAIGAVCRGGKLMTVTRTRTRFDGPRVDRAETPEHAASVLLKIKGDLRRTYACDPVIHLASGHVAGRVIELVRKHDVHSVDQLIEGAGPSHACAPGGAEYANRLAEVADTFLAALHAGRILLAPDAELTDELLAFERGERNGKITYPPLTEIAETIGRFPERALAVMLAHIPAPPPGTQERVRAQHDPYAALL